MDLLQPIHRFDRFQQQHRALAIIFATVKKFGDDQASNLGVVVAFYAFFSIFPLLLVFVTVLGLCAVRGHRTGQLAQHLGA